MCYYPQHIFFSVNTSQIQKCHSCQNNQFTVCCAVHGAETGSGSQICLVGWGLGWQCKPIWPLAYVTLFFFFNKIVCWWLIILWSCSCDCTRWSTVHVWSQETAGILWRNSCKASWGAMFQNCLLSLPPNLKDCTPLQTAWTPWPSTLSFSARFESNKWFQEQVYAKSNACMGFAKYDQQKRLPKLHKL